MFDLQSYKIINEFTNKLEYNLSDEDITYHLYSIHVYIQDSKT